MKKRLFTLLAAMILLIIGVVPAYAIEATFEEFRAAIAEMNEECPIDYGDGLELISLELDDEYKTLDFIFYIDEESFSVKFVNENKEVFEEVFKDELIDSFLNGDDPDAEYFYKLLKHFGYGITVAFINEDEEVAVLVYLSDEI